MSAGARIDYQRSSLTTRGLLWAANGLVAALIREVCVAKHRQVVSLDTDMPAGGRRSAVVPVKRDLGVRPNSPAVRCRLRRRLIQQPTSPAVPSRLTLGQRCRSCATSPRASLVASIPGGGGLPPDPPSGRPRPGQGEASVVVKLRWWQPLVVGWPCRKQYGPLGHRDGVHPMALRVGNRRSRPHGLTA